MCIPYLLFFPVKRTSQLKAQKRKINVEQCDFVWRNSSPIYAWNASAPYKVRDVFNICYSCRELSYLSAVHSHRQWKDIIVNCAACINWEKETLRHKHLLFFCPPAFPSCFFFFSPCFLPLLHHSSMSTCSCLSFCLVLRSKITTDCCELRG